MKKNIHLLSVVLIVVSLNIAAAQESCFSCHGERDFARTTPAGEEQSLFVSDSAFHASIHGSFDCTTCHTDAVSEPHPEKLEKVSCAACHDDVAVLYGEGIHGKASLSGDQDAPNCASCHGTHTILSASNTQSATNPIHLPQTCGKCHGNGGVATTHDIQIAAPIEKFERGVHGRALAGGNENAASCNTCHDSHKLLSATDPRSPVFRANLSHTCARCHQDVAHEYDQSIHGTALAKGVLDVPSCTYCHGEHEILSPKEPGSPTSALNVAEKTCAPCHGLPRLNEKYGLLPDLVSSYTKSYHGLASLRGSKIAANCTSCHGVHNILPASSPLATIHPANLPETCGKCHMNVTEAFAQSYIHATPTSQADRLSDYIRDIYIYLIVVVIGGMVVHNAIIYFSYVRAKARLQKQQKTIQRFDAQWVVQHILIFISFTILVITGFALKFPNAGWARFLTSIGFTERIRSVTHRVAAIILISAGVYHLLYLFFSRHAKGELKSLLPNINDLRQFFVNMKHHLGLTKEKPDFDRYGYVEKAEYWALVWGTVIMAATGFVLWFPTAATFVLPAWIVKVSETIHYYEAWLATLAIALYHMFFAIFHPEDYPMNLTGFTGKMTEEEAKERYPAWYRKITSQSGEHEEDKSQDEGNIN
jgi:formate dehydrogenase gamma subunit